MREPYMNLFEIGDFVLVKDVVSFEQTNYLLRQNYSRIGKVIDSFKDDVDNMCIVSFDCPYPQELLFASCELKLATNVIQHKWKEWINERITKNI